MYFNVQTNTIQQVSALERFHHSPNSHQADAQSLADHVLQEFGKFSFIALILQHVVLD